MNILVNVHYQNDGSPTASFVNDQIMELNSLGHSVFVIVPVPIGKKDYSGKRFSFKANIMIIGGITHIFYHFLSISKYGRKRFNAISAILMLKLFFSRILNDFHPDVIHSHTLGFDSEIGAWLKKKTKCPLIVTTHGSDTSIPFRSGKTDYLKQWCDKADAVVCVGSSLKKMLQLCDVKTDLYVITNGFNAKYRCDNAEKRPNSIIQVGSLIPSKRTDVTIRAFKAIVEKYPSASLTVVGEGPEQERLIKLCKELDLESSVVFTGQISNKEVLERMAMSEYFVMVSSPEGFGIVYLEAMASKCFTIGAENEGIADIIVSGENGVLLPVDNPDAIFDTILKAVSNPEFRYYVSQNGYTCALNHTWHENALLYQNLYQKLSIQNEKNSLRHNN